MKCPVCKKEMEKGYVQAVNMITWVKEKHVFSLLPMGEDVILSRNLIGPVSIEAYICKDCKQINMNYGK